MTVGKNTRNYLNGRTGAMEGGCLRRQANVPAAAAPQAPVVRCRWLAVLVVGGVGGWRDCGAVLVVRCRSFGIGRAERTG